jgi:FKBP-type peptidyl-prolyl cis-trans isomerase
MNLKRSGIILMAFGSLLCFNNCVEAVKLDTDKKKLSYTIGTQMGESLKSQGIDVDVKVLSEGISDALGAKKLQLTKEEMSAAMQKAQEAAYQKRKSVGDENKKVAVAFLEKNKAEKGVKTTASGMQFIVLTEGKGKKPKATDMVEVHYRGTLLDGTEFDSSFKRNQTAKFPVNGVIKGWTEALQDMQEGEKRKLFIPPELAYGEMSPPSIPSNSLLVFEVELIKVEAGGKAAGK